MRTRRYRKRSGSSVKARARMLRPCRPLRTPCLRADGDTGERLLRNQEQAPMPCGCELAAGDHLVNPPRGDPQMRRGFGDGEHLGLYALYPGLVNFTGEVGSIDAARIPPHTVRLGVDTDDGARPPHRAVDAAPLPDRLVSG